MVERLPERQKSSGRILRRLQGYGNGVMPRYWYEHINRVVEIIRSAERDAENYDEGTLDHTRLTTTIMLGAQNVLFDLRSIGVTNVTVGPDEEGYSSLIPTYTDPRQDREVVVTDVHDSNPLLRNIRQPRVRMQVLPKNRN
jgi:hypothetical protein